MKARYFGNRLHRLFVVYILVIKIYLISAFGQVPSDIKFSLLTRENGLSGSTVFSIYQDSKGYMWIGTDNGLNKFNGYEFKSYKHIGNNVNSISNNYINSILEDRKKRLWIATNFGINLFNRDNNTFTRFNSSPGDPQSIIHNVVNTIFEDKTGKIWFGTLKGLNLWNEQSGNFQSYADPKNAHINISCIFEYRPGLFLLGTGDGLRLFDTLTRTFQPANKIIKNASLLDGLQINCIATDKKGNLWVGTDGKGVYVFNPPIKTFKNYIKSDNDHHSLSNNVVKSICCDRKGNIWIGIENGGVNVWNPSTNNFSHYENDPLKPASFSQKTASALFEDNQGNIWIGSINGINLYSPEKSNFKSYTQGVSSEGLSYKNIRTFLEDESGSIWIGTDGGGINIWDPQKNTFKQFRHDPKDSTSIGSDAVLHIFKDKKGTIWVGTWGGGLNRFNKSTGTFTRFLTKPNNPSSINSNHVMYIFEDTGGYLWIATYSGGINRFDPGTGRFNKIFTSPDEKTSVIGKNIQIITKDRENNLWFGANDGGLTRFTVDKNRFTSYFFPKRLDPKVNIRTLFSDSKGRLWAGENGLYLFNNAKNEFNRFTSDHYLAEERIQAINEDDSGYLWISTSNGLIKLNPQTSFIKRYTDADGLQGLEFNQNAGYKTQSGLMLFGGLHGFNAFYPNSIKNFEFSYPIYLTELQIFNKTISSGDRDAPIHQEIDVTKEISLNHKQSVFSLEYAALNYLSPLKTQYAYILEGIDKDWNYVGTQRKASYNNLPAGSYIFRVKASTPQGLWNMKPTSLKIIITPPFWLTWWFKSLLVIIVAGSAVMFVYSRRKAELKAILEQKKEEIHQFQLQFFTNISHEFRTPLTLILGPLEQILKENKNPEFNRHYLTMHRNTKRMMQLISELMDFRKVETGVLKLKVTRNNFSTFFQEIAQEFEDNAIQQKINFAIVQNANHSDVWFDRQVVEKILLNLIHNSFKYTPEHGSISLEVLETVEGYAAPFNNSLYLDSQYQGYKYIHVSISDTGTGISKESLNHLFERYYRITDTHLGSGVGLAFVKSLTFLHKGNIKVYSERNKGTNILISIPCDTKDYTPEEKEQLSEAETGVQIESIKYRELIQRTAEIGPSITAHAGAPTILIVDDHAELRDFIKGILSPHYNIVEANDGMEGIAVALDKSPLLIISDLMMPRMNGIDFCAHIKTDIETSHIPFILLTAKDALDSRIEGAESGADYYFSKPVSTELLLLTIKNIFKQRQKIKDRYLKDYQVEIHELVHTSKDKEFFNQLLLLLDRMMEDPELNIDFLCKEIGMSKTKLYNKIKSITGQTINEFIRTIRLKKAVEIMTHEDITITEVMYRVGILSNSYFTTIFKKEFGLTPSQFQSRIKTER